MTYFFFILFQAFYFVSFTDKVGSSHLALSEEAIARREKYAIALDMYDWAVSDVYLDSIRQAGGDVAHTSRWMNGATVEMPDSLAQKIDSWSFVRSVEKTRDLSGKSAVSRWRFSNLSDSSDLSVPSDLSAVADSYDSSDLSDLSVLSDPQLAAYNLLPLHTMGYQGQGVTVAVIDAGFPAVDTAICYTSLWDEGRLLGKYDFAHYTVPFDAMTAAHGSFCLSTLAAQLPDYNGAAPQAAYYLMRTEEWETECPKEADNWIAAVECCDSLGVDIISTSLGYYFFDDSIYNYQYSFLDGKSYRASMAAAIAARKGMLLCVAAGNSGNTLDWQWVGVPSDADSILTVGAVNTDSVRAAFSSVGPTADGRVKPDVCAVGQKTCLIEPSTGLVRYSNGTSFACPLVAGLAASLWSALPDASAMEIRERIIRSAHLYSSPNNFVGYGIPDAEKAYTIDLSGPSDSSDLSDLSDPYDKSDLSAVASPRKIWHQGHIYIVHHNKIYTILGTKAKSNF